MPNTEYYWGRVVAYHEFNDTKKSMDNLVAIVSKVHNPDSVGLVVFGNSANTFNVEYAVTNPPNSTHAPKPNTVSLVPWLPEESVSSVTQV